MRALLSFFQHGLKRRYRIKFYLLIGVSIGLLGWILLFDKASDGWPLEITSADQTHHFTVELALTREEQAEGLMFRETLAEDAGMLFVYRKPQVRSMWMKNTPLSLDMLFLDNSGTIRHIARQTLPYSTRHIWGPSSTLYVLELRGGVTQKLNIQVGDQIRELPPPDYSRDTSS